MDEDFKEKKNNKIKFRQNTLKTRNQNRFWVFFITAVSFVASAVLLFVSQRIFNGVSVVVAIIILFIIVLTGIVFDMIGIAVAAANETPFHAMASRKVEGAKRAIKLIRNADKVASFANDVVGDICGVISGTISALIVFRVADSFNLFDAATLGIALSGFVASLTVGGKALGKTFAIRNSCYIVYRVSLFIEIFART